MKNLCLLFCREHFRQITVCQKLFHSLDIKFSILNQCYNFIWKHLRPLCFQLIQNRICCIIFLCCLGIVLIRILLSLNCLLLSGRNFCFFRQDICIFLNRSRRLLTRFPQSKLTSRFFLHIRRRIQVAVSLGHRTAIFCICRNILSISSIARRLHVLTLSLFAGKQHKNLFHKFSAIFKRCLTLHRPLHSICDNISSSRLHPLQALISC